MGGWPVGYLNNEVEKLNSGPTRTNPDSSKVEHLNHGTPHFKSSTLNCVTMLPPLNCQKHCIKLVYSSGKLIGSFDPKPVLELEPWSKISRFTEQYHQTCATLPVKYHLRFVTSCAITSEPSVTDAVKWVGYIDASRIIVALINA